MGDELELQFSEQVQHCRDLLAQHTRDELVSKALRSSEKALAQLKSCHDETLTSPSLKEALQTYTQSVLDSTYHQECRLVEGEFPSDITRNVITTIIGSLCKPAVLCGSVENIQPTLGTEQWECINWRVGALMYMYVHELMSSDGRRTEVDSSFIYECCIIGVCHLSLMLSARAPLGRDDDYTSHDATLPLLLQQGVFSDVHMLALMYAGELCYWAWEVSGDSGKEREEGGAGDDSIGGRRTGEGELKRLEGAMRDQELKDRSISSSNEDSGSKLCTSATAGNRTENFKTRLSARERGQEWESTAGGVCVSGGSSLNEALFTEQQQIEHQQQSRLTGSPGAQPLLPRRELPLFSVLLCQVKGEDHVHKCCSEFSPTARGQEILGRYIEMARGPLKDQNWSYARAVQLMVQLKRAAR